MKQGTVEKIAPAVWGKRLVVYCLGLLVMAFGVAVSVRCDLGVSPVNSLPYVISEITGMTMGTWTILVFSVYILMQAVLLGRNFRPWRLLQLLCTVLFGWFVDFANWAVALALPDPGTLALPAVGEYVVRLVYLVVSMALVGLGILLYLGPDLLSLPGEGIMQVIAQKTGRPLHQVKIAFDTTVSLLALVLSLAWFRQFHGVREGTVLAALGVGQFLGLFTAFMGKGLKDFLEMPREGA